MRAVGPLAFVDLATTGLAGEPGAEILEIGGLRIDAEGRVETFETLLRPRRPVPRAVTRHTGIRDDDVASAPHLADVADEIAAALRGRTLVAHAADFERGFLARQVSPDLDKEPCLDTLELLGVTHPDAPDLRFETLAGALLGRSPAHRALADALDTARLLSSVARRAERGERRYAVARAALARFAPASPWLALLGDGDAAEAGDVGHRFVPIPPTREPRVPFDEDAIEAALRDPDRGARYFPGYRVREQQVQMARRFARTLREGGRLVLEGGTGSGKSLAYLAAAIPFAVERAEAGSRGAVVVSTRTKLLQDQLLAKDIPAAGALLGIPDLRALAIKGRANYACARRLSQVLAEGAQAELFEDDRLAYAALVACARTRPHGEVGTLPSALPGRFPTLRDLVRRAVAARSEECTREQCASQPTCPFGRRRRALADAHLAVANHDLLLRWPPDYPAFAHAVIDEAHELAGVADEVYAVEVRPEEVLTRVDDLFGRPAEARRRAEPPLLTPDPAEVAAARASRRSLEQELSALGEAVAHRVSESGEVQLPAHADRVFPRAAELAASAADRIAGLAELADEVAPEGCAIDPSPASARAIADLREAAAGLRAAFAPAADDTVAAFERLAPPYGRWRLAVRQVAPAATFHTRFAGRLEVLACTSASLFVGGDPFAALGELEIGSRTELPVVELAVESPFPYAEHMRVVALDGSGDLVTDAADVLEDLARRLGGRTLGLFTSLRRMRDVAGLLADRLRPDGLEVLVPRRATDDPAALVRRFRRGEGSVLLGARTFWQGLDLPGPALQAVVIEKLPFEVPTELRRRREARLRALGENAFERYGVGKMLLHLKQMIGRLIRSETDRGLVVIVEGRTDRRYFARLSEALPPGCAVRASHREDLAEVVSELGLPME